MTCDETNHGLGSRKYLRGVNLPPLNQRKLINRRLPRYQVFIGSICDLLHYRHLRAIILLYYIFIIVVAREGLGSECNEN